MVAAGQSRNGARRSRLSAGVRDAGVTTTAFLGRTLGLAGITLGTAGSVVGSTGRMLDDGVRAVGDGVSSAGAVLGGVGRIVDGVTRVLGSALVAAGALVGATGTAVETSTGAVADTFERTARSMVGRTMNGSRPRKRESQPRSETAQSSSGNTGSKPKRARRPKRVAIKST